MATLSIPVGSQDHIQGNAKAACTLLEYGDYQCPNCGAAYPLVQQIQKHFGKRLRFVFRNFPLTNIHAMAQSAAEVAEFANSHGQFWKMHDLLYENQAQLGEELFTELATKLTLDAGTMQKALEDKVFTAHVRTDFLGGVRSGVNGTPTFYINDARYDDSIDFDSMIAAIEKAATAS